MTVEVDDGSFEDFQSRCFISIFTPNSSNNIGLAYYEPESGLCSVSGRDLPIDQFAPPTDSSNCMVFMSAGPSLPRIKRMFSSKADFRILPSSKFDPSAFDDSLIEVVASEGDEVQPGLNDLSFSALTALLNYFQEDLPDLLPLPVKLVQQ